MGRLYVLSLPSRYKTRFLLLVGIVIASRQISGVLISAPLRMQNNVMQCGCRSNRLYALSPDPSLPSNQIPISIDLTAFFNFNTNNSSTCAVEGGNGGLSTSHFIPAALVALDEINNSSDLLQGYHLQLDVRNSMCDGPHAITELVDSIANRLKGNHLPNSPYNLGVIGPGCEAVTKAVAGVIGRSLRLPVISYGNPPVVEKRLPTLFHTSRSVLLSMKSAIGLLSHFNWTNNIAFISEDSDFFVLTVENVVKTTINGSIILSDSSGDIPVSEFAKVESRSTEARINSVAQFMTSVREKNIRVIVGLLSQRTAAELICLARSGVIPGDGFVYIFVGSFTKDWWKSETDFCSISDLDVQSALVVSGEVINPNDDAILKSGRTLHDFKVDYSQRLAEWCTPEIYSRRKVDSSVGSVYDAVWALALALNESADLIQSAVDSGVHYNSDILDSILDSLNSTNFLGVSGQLYFENGQRGGADTIQQIQDGDMLVVAQFEGELSVSEENSFLWNGSDNATPRDQITVIQKNVGLHWLVIVSIFTLAGIIFGICMWIFNWWYAKHKILLASSQRLNYIIIVGVFFGYFTVIILTILNSPASSLMSDNAFKALCLTRIWMLPLSFTFTYGTLFARAWRIYKVFNNPWTSARLYKDYYLLLVVLVATAIDVAILLPWTVIDPYRRFPLEEEVNYDSYSQCIFSNCSSDNVIVWLAILALYKIIFIMVGILVISLVRQGVIRRKIFDDSRSLAAAVYTTSLAFMIGLPLTILFLLAGQALLSYLVSSLWVNISSSGTLICIFLPKFYKIVIKKDSGKMYKTARSLYFMKSYSRSEFVTNGSMSPPPNTESLTNNYTKADFDGIQGTNELTEL